MRATHLSVLGMRSLSMVSILLVTAGCAPMNQQWYPSEDEGASVRAAIRSQSVYPDGRPPSSVKPGMITTRNLLSFQRCHLYLLVLGALHLVGPLVPRVALAQPLVAPLAFEHENYINI
jgi:hypothetical protein